MPIGTVHGLPADSIPAQTRVDPWAWFVRVALLVLVSPALLLVLIVGGFFLMVQMVSRCPGWFWGLFRRDQPPGSPDLDGPGVLPSATVISSTAIATRACRGRSA
jgi:hypothetical protein